MNVLPSEYKFCTSLDACERIDAQNKDVLISTRRSFYFWLLCRHRISTSLLIGRVACWRDVTNSQRSIWLEGLGTRLFSLSLSLNHQARSRIHHILILIHLKNKHTSRTELWALHAVICISPTIILSRLDRSLSDYTKIDSPVLVSPNSAAFLSLIYEHRDFGRRAEVRVLCNYA